MSFDDFALILKLIILLLPPVLTSWGIKRSRTLWPITFLTFVGPTITVINFHIAAQFAELAAKNAPATLLETGTFYRALGWVLAAIPLVLGLRKLLAMRKEKLRWQLLDEEEPAAGNGSSTSR